MRFTFFTVAALFAARSATALELDEEREFNASLAQTNDSELALAEIRNAITTVEDTKLSKVAPPVAAPAPAPPKAIADGSSESSSSDSSSSSSSSSSSTSSSSDSDSDSDDDDPLVCAQTAADNKTINKAQSDSVVL